MMRAQRDCKVEAGLKVMASRARPSVMANGGGSGRWAAGGSLRLALGGRPAGLQPGPDCSSPRLARLSTSHAAALDPAMSAAVSLLEPATLLLSSRSWRSAAMPARATLIAFAAKRSSPAAAAAAPAEGAGRPQVAEEAGGDGPADGEGPGAAPGGIDGETGWAAASAIGAGALALSALGAPEWAWSFAGKRAAAALAEARAWAILHFS
eukprot:8637226-Heterocapsa_arctica.AAC.2